MPTQEIQSTDWRIFCDRFETMQKGQLITVEFIDTNGQRSVLAREVPLQQVRYSEKACNDHILLTLFQQGEREITHDIIEPIHIKVREEDEGSKGLQIDAENGSTILLFSSGRMDELLQGLKTL